MALTTTAVEELEVLDSYVPEETFVFREGARVHAKLVSPHRECFVREIAKFVALAKPARLDPTCQTDMPAPS